MVDVPTVEKRSPRQKPEARRQQIVEAASVCVRRSGFHGANMQEIAQTAGMSVGQIYRYFANKEAIIAAIVAVDLVDMRERFAAWEQEPGPIEDTVIRHCGEGLEKCFNAERAAIVLEVQAEAARNPSIARIVREADVEERALCRRFLESARKPGWTDREVEARANILASMFDGFIMRSINDPNADIEAMKPVLQSVMRHLFKDG